MIDLRVALKTTQLERTRPDESAVALRAAASDHGEAPLAGHVRCVRGCRGIGDFGTMRRFAVARIARDHSVHIERVHVATTTGTASRHDLASCDDADVMATGTTTNPPSPNRTSNRTSKPSSSDGATSLFATE